MRTRGNFVQVKRYQIREGTRKIAQLEMMIAEFERMAQELNAQIASEERKSGITDVDHFAYPTFAKAARQRRDNLIDSRNDLEAQRIQAITELAEAEAELQRAELLEIREARTPEGEAATRSAIIG